MSTQRGARLRRLGLSESDIVEACGWDTREMFARYSIKDEAGLAGRLQRAHAKAAIGGSVAAWAADWTGAVSSR